MMGACLLVRRRAIEEVGRLDESFFLFSEETDWCYRFARAGWKTVFTPAAECVHVGGASHGGRLFRENVRGHLHFLLKHKGMRQAEQARLCCGSRCACEASCSAASAAGSTAMRRRGSHRATCPRCSPDERHLAVPTDCVRDRGRTRPRVAGRPRARSAGGGGGAGVGTRLVFAAAAVAFAVGTSLTLVLVLLIGVGAGALPFAFKTRPLGYEPRFGPVPAGGGRSPPVSCSGSRSGTSPARSAATVSSISPERELAELDSLSLDAVSEFPDGGLHPGYAFPLWHASSWRSSPPSRASIRPTSSCTRPRCSRRSPSSSRTRPAGRCSGAGRRPRARRRRVALVALAPGTAARSQPSPCPPRIRARCSRPRRSRWRSPACGRRPARSSRRPPPPRSRSRSCTRPTRSFSGCRSGVPARPLGVDPPRRPVRRDRARGARPARGGVLRMAAPDRAGHRLGAPRCRGAGARAGAVRGPARRRVAGAVPSRPGGAGPCRRGRRRRAAARPPRRPGRASPLGGVRRGWIARCARARARFRRVHPSRTPSRSPRHAELRGSSFAFAFGGGLEVVTALLGPLAAPLALAAGIVLQLVYPGDFDYQLTEEAGARDVARRRRRAGGARVRLPPAGAA